MFRFHLETITPLTESSMARIIRMKLNIKQQFSVLVVDKVIVPAEGTILDVLSSDLHFGTFMAALEEADMARLLAEDGDFTVFAPTDSAFAKLDSETRERVLGGGGCAGDIIMSHVLHQVSQRPDLGIGKSTMMIFMI